MTDLKYCPNYSALAVKQTTDKDIPFVRLRCGMWTCEYCAEKNRQIWRARLINHIVHNLEKKQWSWFTLTAHSKKRGAYRSIANLRQAWDKLIKRMKRKYGDFDYVRIFEKHQDGSYHIHCIASIHFDDIKYRVTSRGKNKGKEVAYSVWLKATAIELKTGMYTHAENFADMLIAIEKGARLEEETTTQTQARKAGLIASYITKYITKITPELKEELGRVRHIQTSQKWTRPERESQDIWKFAFGIYYKDVKQAYDNDQRYVEAGTKRQVTFDDFIEAYIYPPEFGEKNDE